MVSSDGVGSDDDLLIKQVVLLDGDDDLPLHVEHHFSSFKARFGKSYRSVEEHDYKPRSHSHRTHKNQNPI